MRLFGSSCPRAENSPVLKLLAVDANSSLVALGDADLVLAALNLLTRVLSGVYVCGRARENKLKTSADESSLFHAGFTLLLSAIGLHLQSQIPDLSVSSAQPTRQSELSARRRAALHYFKSWVFLTGQCDPSILSASSL